MYTCYIDQHTNGEIRSYVVLFSVFSFRVMSYTNLQRSHLP